MTQVSDLMTKNVISVSSEMLIMDAVQLLFKHKLDGAPVIDKDIKVVGILTDYELMIKDTYLHLPTLLRILNEFDLYIRDRSSIKGELSKILSLRVKDVMNSEPRLLLFTTSIEEATKTFAQYHQVNPIPIVNEAGMLLGVLSRYDLIKFYSGEKNLALTTSKLERPLDNRINSFIRAFATKFHFVSKFRTQVWFAVSLVSAILLVIFGFYIAVASLIKVQF